MLWRIDAILVRVLFVTARWSGIQRASVLGGALARRIGLLLPVSDLTRRDFLLAGPGETECLGEDAWPRAPAGHALPGHPPMMMPALTEITLCYRCPVAPGHTQHIGPGRFHMAVEPPLSPPDSGGTAADIRSLLLAVNSRIESWIRGNPGQWLWLRRR
nr:hypothetical protein [Pseudoroseomonas ludipueritiae]